MKLTKLLKASLVGFALTLPFASQASAQEVLSVMRGATSSNITVAVNRAIVVQSDRPFADTAVANPAIADIATLSESTLYVLGKIPGRTTLTIFGADGTLVANVDVRVVPDIAEFKERLAEILPGENIHVRTANDGIVLSGTVSGARKVARAMELANRYAPDRVTNLMMVGGTQQVMLQVRFAEMERSVSKALRTDFGITGNSGNFTAAAGTSFNGLGSGGGIGFSFGGGGLAVNVILEALESKGIVRTLAEPNLVAVSGQTAEFMAGGEFPFVQEAEDDKVTVAFKPFGVMLKFKPTVIDGNIIKLDLTTEVSSVVQAQVAQTDIPAAALKVRRASTVVEMRDGQSFAIAGLLKDDFADNVGQVPWLGDVPVLGALFRSSDFERRQSELVIIVTPHLVTPTSSEALSMATSNMRIPTEEELFLNGTVEGTSPYLNSSQDIQGSYGYVME